MTSGDNPAATSGDNPAATSGDNPAATIESLSDSLTTVEPVSASSLTPEQKQEAESFPAVDTQWVARVREKVRTRITYLIVVSTLLVAFAGVGFYLGNAKGSGAMLTGVFTPLIGLAGTVIGFYFGGKDATS